MPLKHFTETFLVIVLGAVIALTGLLIATLPHLPGGALPWGVLFVLSIVYPLALYSLFQRRRADNFFRNLHWYPAFMLLLWLALDALWVGGTIGDAAAASYTLSWSLGAVVLGFILLVAYCLKVIRRRVPRLVFLALILVPFTAVALMSERGEHWEDELASTLWQAEIWSAGDSGFLAGLIGERNMSGRNLEPSEDPSEEEWRERLRAQHRREERIAARMEEDKSSGGSASSVASSQKSSRPAMVGSMSSKPSSLPSSGFGWSSIILMLAAMYCATVHNHARRRA